LSNASGGGLAIIPNAAAVSVKVTFPLSTFFSTIVLSEKQSIAALLSSLVGLAGIFSLFGTLLAVTDVSAAALRKNATCSRILPGGQRGRRAFVSSLPSVTEEAQKAEPIEQTLNPLAVAHPVTTKKEVGEALWYKYCDENDTWYTSSTGETTWELPEGAVVVESHRP